MSDPVVSLMPVRIAELVVGKPLRETIYDWHGKVLLKAGYVLENQAQVDDLIDIGFIKDSTWDLTPPPSPPRPSMSMAAQPRKLVLADPPKEDANAGKEVVVAMDDVRWYVGETLYLQLIDNSAVRYTVRMIGFVKNRTVFVTAPVTEGKFEFVRDGQTFIVRAFSGKKAYAFVTTAVKSVHSPHPYLHLAYPKEVRCTVVRKGVRAEVEIIAAVSLASSEKSGAAIITDLSMGGASATIKQMIGSKGEEGLLKFKVRAAGQDEFLSLKMILRSVAPSENGEGFKHGFEFVDVSIHDRLILSAFVHQTLAEGD